MGIAPRPFQGRRPVSQIDEVPSFQSRGLALPGGRIITPRLQPPAAAGAGDVFQGVATAAGALANVALEIGARDQQRRETSALARAEIAINERIAASARETDGNPRAFSARLSADRTAVLEQVPESLRERIGLAFDQKASVAGIAVADADDANADRRTMARAFIQSDETLARLARKTPENRAAFDAAAVTYRDQLLAQLPPGLRDQVAIGLEEKISRGRLAIESNIEARADRARTAAQAAAFARAEFASEQQLVGIAQAVGDDLEAFDSRAQAVREAVVASQPAALREAAALSFDRKTFRLRTDLAGQIARAGKARDEITLLTTAERAQAQAETAMRAGDMDQVGEAVARFTAARAALAAGEMQSPGQIVKMGEDFTTSLAKQGVLAQFDQALEQGPAAARLFADAFARGELQSDDFTPDQRRALTASMLEGVSRHDRAHQDATRRTATDTKVAVAALNAGRTYTGLDDLRTRLTQLGDSDSLVALQEAENLQAEMAAVARLPPQQVQAYVAEARGAGVQDAASAARLTALEKLQTTQDTGLRADPVQYGEDYGLIAQPVAIDPTTPAALPAALAVRREQMAALENDMGRRLALLKPAEVTALQNAFASADSEQAAVLTRLVVNGAGDRAVDVFQAVHRQAPLAAHAGALLATSHAFDPIAIQMFDGDQALRDKLVTLAPPAIRDAWFAENAGPALALAPEAEAAVRLAADALFASTARRTGLEAGAQDRAAKRAYAAAVHAAMGGLVRADGVKTGGSTDVNGLLTVVPPQVPQPDLEYALENIRDQDLAQFGVGGVPPRWVDDAAFRKRQHSDLYFVAVGNGRYRISATDPTGAGPQWLRGAGRAGVYELDLRGVDIPALAKAIRTDGTLVGPQ